MRDNTCQINEVNDDSERACKRYPKEFEEEAVALVREKGYSVAQAAEAVGVTTTVFYKWKEKLEAQLEGTELQTMSAMSSSDFVKKSKSYAWKKRF